MTTRQSKKSVQTPENEKPEIFNISRENGSFKLTRRKFLKITAIASTSAIIVGCGSTPKKVEVINTPTSTLSPTSTKTPTPTKAPTATRTPTATPVVVSGNIKSQGINLRTGPGTDYRSIGTLAAHVSVSIIGKSNDSAWLCVLVNIADLPALAGAPITKNGTVTEIEGWIKSNLVTVTAGSLDDLPIESAPPTPTPLPNEEPTGSEGITYSFTDDYGYTTRYTLPCGSPIPQGAICECNCVAVCSCDGYTAPVCSCDSDSGGMICTCDVVSYWYPN